MWHQYTDRGGLSIIGGTSISGEAHPADFLIAQSHSVHVDSNFLDRGERSSEIIIQIRM